MVMTAIIPYIVQVDQLKGLFSGVALDILVISAIIGVVLLIATMVFVSNFKKAARSYFIGLCCFVLVY